ncbi:MAG: acyltransferase family protein [Lachnospiraceae bacterium]|nr:acyltransferase family protein [Lachnospiraceae bacterium]
MVQTKSPEGSMGYFNIARGIGMFLIIWGHSLGLFHAWQTGGRGPLPASLGQGGEWKLFQGAGSVLGGGIMAMFFLISGFSFYKRSPKKCFSIQKKTLLYPYWITVAAILISKLLLAALKHRSFMEHGGAYILTYLLGLNAEGGGSLAGIPVESVSIFWFVLALFGGWIIYNAIVQCKKESIQWILVGAGAVLAWLLGLISRVWIFCLPQAFSAAFFLAAGVQIRRWQLLEKRLSAGSYALIGLLLFICAAFGQVNMVNNIWRLGIIDMAGSVCCGFVLLKLYRCLMRHMPQGRVVSWFESAGLYSMWVICLHCYEKVIFPWYRLPGVFPDSPVLGTMVCVALRIVLMYGMYRLLSLLIIRIKKKKKVKRKIILEE